MVEEFGRMVELELRELKRKMQGDYVMDMGIGRKGLWEAFEAEANWTHGEDLWRRSLAQEARNLGIIGIKALFFAANSRRMRRWVLD